MSARLRWVAAIAQPGPVLYRDPLGVIAPDGGWLAYTQGLHVRARRIAGGPVCELGGVQRFVSHLAWLPDSRRVASFGRDPVRGELSWWIHELGGSAQRLWPEQPHIARVRQLAFAANGTALGVIPAADGSELVRLDAQGRVLETTRCAQRWSHPVLGADGRSSAGLVESGDGRPQLALPCGTAPAPGAPEAYGPIALSPPGDVVYCARPNARGTLDLHALARDGRSAQLTHFTRDTWAPSVARDGRVMFKLQEYTAFVARVDADGGAPELLSSFQCETPTWHPDGRRLGVTYGRWRRAVDDHRYPDIDQSLGVIALDGALPAEAPAQVVFASESEDQGMAWSPDGRWIALHTHSGPADDVWLMPADRTRAAELLTHAGSETGWPRWSPDGRWVACTTELRLSRGDELRVSHDTATPDRAERAPARRGIVCVGVDPRSGGVTHAPRAVALEGYEGRPFHAEWSADGRELFFESADGGALRSLRAVPAGGGRPRVIHEFESEQGMSGIAASPDGRWLAYVAPDRAGVYQIFRVPVTGGRGEALTGDPSHKTQPCYSPDGRALALTQWSYEVSFWLLDPPAALSDRE